MARRRGGRFAPELHAEAQRLLAEADYPPQVKQAVLMALRGGRPDKQVCLACGKAAQHCQLWGPPALTQAVPDPTAKVAVYWLCDTHHGQLTDAAIVTWLYARARPGAKRPHR